MEETSGPYWRSKADYLLVCACLSTDVSSVFTFALYTINYGAAFLLSYLVLVCSFGIPLIHFELMQAQFSGRGVLGIYDAFPISRGLGYVILLMLLFRVVLTCPTMAFVIATFLDCFQEPPPWSKCSALFGKDNSPACYDMRGEQEGCDVSYTQMAEDFEMRNLSDGIPVVYRGKVSLVPKEEFENVTSGCSKGSLFVSYGYFKTKLVQPTDCFRYDLVLCSAAGFVIMFTVLFNGLVGFGKVMYVVLIAPKVLLMLILIHGSSLHGPGEEVIAFPPLRWSNLWDLNIWISAVAQCFMSLPVGGTRYAMLARYSPYENDIEWDAQIICAVNVLLNTFMSMALLSFKKHFEFTIGKSTSRALNDTHPLTRFLIPSTASITIRPLFGIPRSSGLFLLFPVVVTITSQLLTTEVIFSELQNAFPLVRNQHRLFRAAFYSALQVASLALFEGTAVAYRVRIVPSTEIKFTIFILIIQTLTFFRGYGIQRTSFDYEFMLNRQPTTYMLVCWTIVIPFILLASFFYLFLHTQKVVVYGDAHSTDNVYNFMGLSLAALTVMLIALWTFKTRRYTLAASMAPFPSWGPRQAHRALEYQDKIIQLEASRRKAGETASGESGVENRLLHQHSSPFTHSRSSQSFSSYLRDAKEHYGSSLIRHLSATWSRSRTPDAKVAGVSSSQSQTSLPRLSPMTMSHRETMSTPPLPESRSPGTLSTDRVTSAVLGGGTAP